MITIKRYKTVDGCEFEDPLKAEEHERLIACVNDIMMLLPKIPSGNRVVVDAGDAAEAKRQIVKLCRELFPDEAVFKHDASKIHPMSYAGRFLDDAGPTPIRDAWHWFMCLNGDWLYEQPFYALNPKEYKEKSGAK